MRLRFFVLIPLLAAAVPAQQAAPALPDWVSSEQNVPYDRHQETVVDILQPKAPSKEKRPGVLVIHGGWVAGARLSTVQNFCLPYLEKGFVVANVEYRLAKVAPAPAAVCDVLMAADWFRRNARKYNLDPRRIVATGGSAGGHLALMVGMAPKSAKLGPPARVAAVVNFYGITDVTDQLSGPNVRECAVTWLPEQPGLLELARRVSPINYIRKDVPPILTIHGDADPTVPYEHGVRLTRALREAGAQAELIAVPNGRHGFPKEKLAQLYPQIFLFLKRHGVLR